MTTVDMSVRQEGIAPFPAPANLAAFVTASPSKTAYSGSAAQADQRACRDQDDPVTDTADTYGWDTVFAVHIADVNAAIAAAGSSPTTWTQVDQPDGFSASGTFGPWAITPGGSGDIIFMSVPMPTITLTSPSGTIEASAVATIEVRLNLLPSPSHAATQNLVVSTTATGTGEVAVTIADIAFADPVPAFLGQAAIQALLAMWLNTNLGDFDQVFATIALDRTAQTQAFQWMQPTTTSYAYTDLGSATDGALAILCMTGGRSATGLVQQVSNACLPMGARAALLIAKARVMDQLLLPSLPLTFPGASASDFALSSTGDSIVNAGGGATFNVTASNGDQYDATIVAFGASINGAYLAFDATTSTQLAAGIYAYTRAQSMMIVSLGSDTNGDQALTFSNASDPIIIHWTDADPGYSVTEELLAAAGIAAALVATVLTDGAAAGTIALAIGFAAGVVAVTEDAIELAGTQGAPAIAAAMLDATGAFTWAQGSGLSLTSATLNDSLQLAGNLSRVATIEGGAKP